MALTKSRKAAAGDPTLKEMMSFALYVIPSDPPVGGERGNPPFQRLPRRPPVGGLLAMTTAKLVLKIKYRK